MTHESWNMPIPCDLAVSSLRWAHELQQSTPLEIHVHPSWLDRAITCAKALEWNVAVIQHPEWADEDDWAAVFEAGTRFSPGA